jgi:hypothetical protein
MQYSQQLNNFKYLISIAKKIHTLLNKNNNLSHRYELAHQLFNRLIGQCESIIKLLPLADNFSTTETNSYYDLASVASLARNFTETYEMYYYLIIDNIDDKERELRNSLLRLHMKSEILEIYKTLGYNTNENELECCKQERNKLREEIKNNYLQLSASEVSEKFKVYSFIEKKSNDEFYRELKNKKGRCLNSKTITEAIIKNLLGDEPITNYIDDLEENATVNIKILLKRFDGLKTYFSNHTHTSTLSLSEMLYETEIGDDSRHFYSLSIRHTMFYLGVAICNIVELFKGYNIDMNNQDMNFVVKNMLQYILDLQVISRKLV